MFLVCFDFLYHGRSPLIQSKHHLVGICLAEQANPSDHGSVKNGCVSIVSPKVVMPFEYSHSPLKHDYGRQGIKKNAQRENETGLVKLFAA